jgi:hypothetical protein
MKKIAIFCRSFEMGVEPFTSDYYWRAYRDLYFALKQRGIEAYFTTDNNSYRDYGLFDIAYTVDEDGTPADLKPVRDVRVDLVFDRGGFIGRNVATVNPPMVQRIGMDKIEMYKHFGEYQPFSVACNNFADVTAAFNQIDGDKIVVKEPKGFGGGKQVYIGDKQDVLKRLPERFPLLVQEFLDTSAGVPGYVDGVHDVRLSMCGGEVIGCYIRKAKEGAWHSNVSQGGHMIFFNVEETPAELREMAESVDTLFARHPRYFAADFMYTEKGWKMLEINPYLALLPRTDGAAAQYTLERLADYLVSVAHPTIRKRSVSSPERSVSFAR